jgi:hypothetical protein
MCEVSQMVVYLLRFINTNPTKTVCELSQMVVYLLRLINTNPTITVCELSQIEDYLSICDSSHTVVMGFVLINLNK